MRIFNLILFASFIRAMCIFCMTTTKRQNGVNQIYKTGRIHRDNKPLMLILMLITIIKMASCSLLCQTFYFFWINNSVFFLWEWKQKCETEDKIRPTAQQMFFCRRFIFKRDLHLFFFSFFQASRSELNKNRKSLLVEKQRNETVWKCSKLNWNVCQIQFNHR